MVSWEELENACQHCRACPLAETRTNVVFGVGSRQADILFIGEGPRRVPPEGPPAPLGLPR